MILFILSICHFVPPFWFIVPYSEDKSMRTVCRGWGCSVPNNDTYKYEMINKIHSDYRSGRLNESLVSALEPYLDKKLPPAIAAFASIYLFGLDGNVKDIEKSYELLNMEECKNSWICNEILAFHPKTKESERTYYLDKAADLGSLIGNKIRADELYKQGKLEECIKILRHLATASSTSWMRKKRGGLKYAKSIRILLTKHDNKEWETIKDLAKDEHLPSILWLADAYINKNKDVKVDEKLLIQQLYSLYKDSIWKYDPTEMLNSRDTNFDRDEFLKYISHVDDVITPAILSYPSIYKKI